MGFDPDNPNRKKIDGSKLRRVVDVADGATATATIGVSIAPRPTAASTSILRTASPPVAAATQIASIIGRTVVADTRRKILPLMFRSRRNDTRKRSRTGKREACSRPGGDRGAARVRSAAVVAGLGDRHGTYSNIDSLRQFKQAALDEGWVIVAADGVEVEKNKEGSMRWPCIAAAFDYLMAKLGRQ